MIGDVAGDQLRLERIAGELVVLAGELVRGLNRFRSAAGEEHAVEIARRQVGDAGSQLDRPRVGEGPVGVEAQLFGLVGSGLSDVGTAMADVDAEQRR